MNKQHEWETAVSIPSYSPKPQGLYHPQFEHDACGTGFIAHLRGEKSYALVQQALTILQNLDHRGARGSDPDTGDGAGILLQIPHQFFQEVCPENNIDLPEPGQYGVGVFFLPQDKEQRRLREAILDDLIVSRRQQVLGWRTVPTDNRTLGRAARDSEPVVRQVFIRRSPSLDDVAFERVLYLIRRQAERAGRRMAARSPLPAEQLRFYAASLSSRTLVYKGMLTPAQLPAYYPDLSHPAMTTGLALVHSRFSTNTFPSWERAHPNRYMIHNGEINTLRGNVNWMHARAALLESEPFGDDLRYALPIIDPDGSDSAMFDNVLEFLVLNGRSLAHAMMMMIPEPWQKHQDMAPERRAFYEFHACLTEPWDGPASIAFSDGVQIGAVLDRNGLRPSRYIVTEDDRVIMASEVGVLDVPPQSVRYKGRLQPGRMLLVDTQQGRIISDEEIKRQIAQQQPYQQWLQQHMLTLDDLPITQEETRFLSETGFLTLTQLQQAFGYTFEELRLLITPMAQKGVEALGAMGNDTPLAVLSDKPQPLYNYFKQLFAQVTNPPIDALREELITGTEVFLGSDGNLLHPTPESCRRIKLKHPILTNDELNRLRHLHQPGFKTATLPILFPIADGVDGLEWALKKLFAEANAAVEDGVNLLILSDRGVDDKQAAIPALLAASGLHHHLIRTGARARVSLMLESGEPREVHHYAVLIGYGVEAINPYLAYETISDSIAKGLISGVGVDEAIHKYIKAVVKGVVKVISKMGISTMQSYHSAQIFEALGLSQELVNRYFTRTPTRIGGIDLAVLYEEVRLRHESAFPERPSNGHALPAGGRYQWREDGESHLFNPYTVHKLQHAVRDGDYAAFKEYSAAINSHNQQVSTLRGLLEFKFAAEPVPLDEVEPVESICRRFKTGAMSYGSISQEAHEALAVAMNRIGGKSNTGEGGEDPARHRDNRNSAIKQVASGRFGVTSEYLVSAEEIQIKMAQGAKPGEGGQLPGRKVYPWVAKVRHSTPGVGLISPPPHHDIYSIEDLAQLIFDLKNANPQARINVKLVSEVGVGTIAAGVAKGKADVILISGYDGGTGASPKTSIMHAGLPWELGLAETHQTLRLNNLRSRVRLETDGQLKTGRDVVVAALLGAEEYGFATAPLVSLGCVMMRVCHMDTCPVGVATQNPALRAKFKGDPQHVVNFMHFIAEEMRELMTQLGFRTVDEMIGRTDMLEAQPAAAHWKASGVDLNAILWRPGNRNTELHRGDTEIHREKREGEGCRIMQEHGLEKTLDYRVLLDVCKPALQDGRQVYKRLPIRNGDRTVGTMVGSELTRRYGAAGLPDDTIYLQFRGSAGQSFGAFVPQGMTLELEGDANDYIGKGLSGGRVIVYPPREATFVAEDNVIIGNVAFYGATSGEAFIRGVAGERFCVRNSGVTAVVEGVGDHGCEYMTGGRVVVLGHTGRNFAAGMSGGVAYVLDTAGDFARCCNQDMVDLEPLTDPGEIADLHGLIVQHAALTGSSLAAGILSSWKETSRCFVKVLPRDYRRMLEKFAEMEATGLSGDEAVMAAFEANKNDLARVTGN
ncbi:MAG: glutamate synthase large subunit [Ardenticatenaceae bacterium]|nr:glutamate synthase large subunit [Ardenticatenaceae bacterium]MCB8991034.1 glutamate synthase large subunit [Ardenticatenaceae bacterium]